MDVVPCHTSIEHPWFREHPERYVWADGDEPPNNWLGAFGGRAWSRDERTGAGTCTPSIPSSPTSTGDREDVREAMGGVLRFWRARGVDGFRLDALDRLLKDPELRDDPPATEPFRCPSTPSTGSLQHTHSRNAPDIGHGLAALREAARRRVPGRRGVPPVAELGPYLEHLDAAFSFELSMRRGPRERAARDRGRARAAGTGRSPGCSPTTTSRASRRASGEHNVRAAALLLLTLPGIVFLFQGDEIGMGDGPGRPTPPDDRAGRDPFRHPMQWDDSAERRVHHRDAVAAVGRPGERNVAAQEADPDSILALYRELIAARRELRGDLAFVDDAAEESWRSPAESTSSR